MTRPVIPADIQKAAAYVYAQLGRGADADEQAIAEALMAERDRCAVAATEQTFDAHEIAQATDYGRGMDHAARTILAAIRTPTGA